MTSLLALVARTTPKLAISRVKGLIARRKADREDQRQLIDQMTSIVERLAEMPADPAREPGGRAEDGNAWMKDRESLLRRLDARRHTVILDQLRDLLGFVVEALDMAEYDMVELGLRMPEILIRQRLCDVALRWLGEARRGVKHLEEPAFVGRVRSELAAAYADMAAQADA